MLFIFVVACLFVCASTAGFLSMNFVEDDKVLQCQKVGHRRDRHEPLLPDKGTCFQRQGSGALHLSSVIILNSDKYLMHTNAFPS